MRGSITIGTCGSWRVGLGVSLRRPMPIMCGRPRTGDSTTRCTSTGAGLLTLPTKWSPTRTSWSRRWVAALSPASFHSSKRKRPYRSPAWSLNVSNAIGNERAADKPLPLGEWTPVVESIERAVGLKNGKGHTLVRPMRMREGTCMRGPKGQQRRGDRPLYESDKFSDMRLKPAGESARRTGPIFR